MRSKMNRKRNLFLSLLLTLAVGLAACAPAAPATEAAAAFPTEALNIMAPAAPGGGSAAAYSGGWARQGPSGAVAWAAAWLSSP